MQKQTRDDIRTNYELEVLRTTVFHSRTKRETIRAAIKLVYDQVLAERLANASAVMGRVS
jgi:hypothetical protein